MPHINVYLSDDDFFALRKLKDDLKCKTQEELLHKMIEIVQQQLSRHRKDSSSEH